MIIILVRKFFYYQCSAGDPAPFLPAPGSLLKKTAPDPKSRFYKCILPAISPSPCSRLPAHGFLLAPVQAPSKGQEPFL